MITVFIAAGCGSAHHPLPPNQARQMLADAIYADQHTIWELDWPDAPVRGAIVVESWRSGERYRFEILEAVPPDLRGQVLVSDGQNSWRYDRFDPPSIFSPVSPTLSPVSDAFDIIERLLNSPAKSASQQSAYLNYKTTQRIELTLSTGDKLILWLDQELGLPVQISFLIDGRPVTLKAREVEPLRTPPDALFKVGEWLRNLP